MIPPPFDYRSPDTIEEALSLLGKYREEAKVLTGGHSLIPALKLRLLAPAVVVDLRRVPGLDAIEPAGDGVRIGALATHRQVETSSLIQARCRLLAETAAVIGDVQVRNVGTLVGSVCHADPAADYPAALVALDAEVAIASPRGERRVRAADFLQGILETALEPDEIVRAVAIPGYHSSSCAYWKIRQSASGFAIAGVAAQLRLVGSRLQEAALGVTGIAARAFRASSVEAALRDKDINAEAVAAAVKDIAAGRELLSDIHASSSYRAHLAGVCARRAILLAASRS